MNKSETLVKLAYALSLAQAEMPHIKFDAKNPFLGNKYASLGAIVDASVPVMTKHGLSIVQFPTSSVEPGLPDHIGVRTVLMHSSGEFLEDVVFIAPQLQKGLSMNQASGVTLTYLRRYAWASVLGLVTEEDTDGDDNPASAENADANAKVSQVFKKRAWTNEQTQAIATIALDAGLEPLTHDDACDILDYSTLPADAPTKTIQSWFKHYMKHEGSMIEKAQSANEAYSKAKNGGK